MFGGLLISVLFALAGGSIAVLGRQRKKILSRYNIFEGNLWIFVGGVSLHLVFWYIQGFLFFFPTVLGQRKLTSLWIDIHLSFCTVKCVSLPLWKIWPSFLQPPLPPSLCQSVGMWPTFKVLLVLRVSVDGVKVLFHSPGWARTHSVDAKSLLQAWILGLWAFLLMPGTSLLPTPYKNKISLCCSPLISLFNFTYLFLHNSILAVKNRPLKLFISAIVIFSYRMPFGYLFIYLLLKFHSWYSHPLKICFVVLHCWRL